MRNSNKAAAPARRAAGTALVHGVYNFDFAPTTNVFINGTTIGSATYTVPATYGNVNSPDNVAVEDWIEFGWQCDPNCGTLKASVNITKECSTSYLIQWREEAGGISRGTATVTLTSADFQGCSNLTRVANSFDGGASQSFAGTTITLTTSTILGDVTEAAWTISCPRVSALVAFFLLGCELLSCPLATA